MILDSRSLACLRIGTALVVVWDMVRALAVAPDWWLLQGCEPSSLPAILRLVDPTLTLQLAALAAIGAGLALALGWYTRPITWIAWSAACSFQFAAGGTADYHNAVLCTLLLWSLLLPTGACLSVDAVRQRHVPQPAWLTRVGGAGLALSLAWMYLSTAMAKTGPSWWPEGSAVWLALLDRSTPTDLGRWLALALPAQVWPPVTFSALVLEYAAAALLLWRRSRALAVAALASLHAGMWLLMDLGSFPLVMLAGLSALVPGTVWDRVGWSAPVRHSAATRLPHRLSGAWVVACLTLSIAGENLAERRLTNGASPAAEHIVRMYYLLGLETHWGMYAPEPLRQTGWWVAVGWLADGSLVDPITDAAPTVAAPPVGGDGSLRRWLALSDAPEMIDGFGPQHAYRNLLVASRADDPDRRLHRLALVWMHEPLTPMQPPPTPEPLWILDWPDGSVSIGELSQALGADVIHRARFDSSGWLLGAASLSPVEH